MAKPMHPEGTVHRSPFGVLNDGPRLQFRLRTLLLFIGAVGVSLGVILHRARERRTAVETIRQCGGLVRYNFEEQPRGSLSFPDGIEPVLPRWVLQAFGKDLFYDVIRVDLLFARPEAGEAKVVFADHLLSSLKKLTRVRAVSLHPFQDDDNALDFVATLTDLEFLYMPSASKVSRSGPNRLEVLHKLSVLRVGDARVGDGWLQPLAHLPLLQELSFSAEGWPQNDALEEESVNAATGLTHDAARGCEATPTDLEHLGRLTALKELRLPGNASVTDDWIPHIAKLQSLEWLDLSNTNVTSHGLMNLKPLKKLRHLDLSGNRGIADKGIGSLAEVATLQELNLYHTKITRTGLKPLEGKVNLQWLVVSVPRHNVPLWVSVEESLKQSFPNCKVDVIPDD